MHIHFLHITIIYDEEFWNKTTAPQKKKKKIKKEMKNPPQKGRHN